MTILTAVVAFTYTPSPFTLADDCLCECALDGFGTPAASTLMMRTK